MLLHLYIFIMWPYWPQHKGSNPFPRTIKFTIYIEDYIYIFKYVWMERRIWDQSRFSSGHELHNLNKRLNKHYNNVFSFFPSCVVVGKRFWKHGLFCIFGPVYEVPGRWCNEFYNFVSSHHKKTLKCKVVKARQTTLDAQRRTKKNCNRSPEWLRWPKYTSSSFQQNVFCNTIITNNHSAIKTIWHRLDMFHSVE